MSAFIPNRREPEVTKRALEKVSEDKEREAELGFDGTWVAHPDLVPLARAEFDKVLGGKPHQKERSDEIETHLFERLLPEKVPGTITLAGLRMNVNVCLQYLVSWLRGQGAAAIHNLMEDAATAEISRSQLWQWVHHRAKTDQGVEINGELYVQIANEETRSLGAVLPEDELATARRLLDDFVLSFTFPEFLTLKAYQLLQ
jgi:malate synthase